MSSATEAPGYPVRLNIAARLIEGALDSGWRDHPAFFYGDRQLTYGDVYQQAARLAGALDGLGVAREQRVLLGLPDVPAFVGTFLGTMWHGAVAVPINPFLPFDRYEFFLRDSRAVVAVVAPWLVDTVIEAAPRLPFLRHVVVFGGGDTADEAWRDLVAVRSEPQVHDGAAIIDAAQASEPAVTHCDEPAFWLYTSGSTGSPKGAVHLHHDIWVSADCWGRRTMHMAPEHVHLSASKMFFAYGLGNSLHCPMWTGGSAVLVAEKPTPANVLAAIARRRVTHFYGVPSFYNGLLNDDELITRVGAGDLESLQVCVSAGETLPAPLCERWMAVTGVPLLDGIGSTELLHVFIANRIDDIRPGCSGRPVEGYEARVADDSGADVEDGTVGDLWVRGDSACAGYWNRHADTKRSVRGEWFVTGDKYVRDADGYYWYTGRADDMFKVHGKWVSPAQVESALLVHEAVREVAVVGSTDEGGLSCAVAYVVPTAPRADLEETLLEHAAKRLSGYMVPSRVVVVDELPKTPTGKIQRYLLRD